MSLTTKKRGNQDYLYDYTKDGGKIKSTYLGKVGDPNTAVAVKTFAEEAEKKKKAKKKQGALEDVDSGLEKAQGPVPLPAQKHVPAHVPTTTFGELPARERKVINQDGFVGGAFQKLNHLLDKKREK